MTKQIRPLENLDMNFSEERAKWHLIIAQRATLSSFGGIADPLIKAYLC